MPRKQKWFAVLPLLAAGCALFDTGPPVRRLSPRVVRERMERGEPLLLVCAYEAKDCRGYHLAGSITLENLESRLDSLPQGMEIVFFCG